jgi:hypothetical protein
MTLVSTLSPSPDGVPLNINKINGLETRPAAIHGSVFALKIGIT